MPRIKAYKGNNALIPVDSAKIVTAFRCPWTDKVYGDKRSYVIHLRKVRENRMRAKIRHDHYIRLKANLLEQTSFTAIANWLELHPEFIWRASNGLTPMPEDFAIRFTGLQIDYSPAVSNTHSAPRGGVYNWRREPDKPTGYPGWFGNIFFEVKGNNSGNITNGLRNLGIHTGTGGYAGSIHGGNKYRYDVIFYLSDWPGLEKMRMWNLLQSDLDNKIHAGQGFVY